MLTVPGQSACSCEQEIVRGGSSRTGYASAISLASVQAITVSVASGRYGPCCSWLPTGSTATGTSGSSGLVCVGSMPSTVMPQLCRTPAAPAPAPHPRTAGTGRARSGRGASGCGASAFEQLADERADLLDLGEEAVVAAGRLDHPQPVGARDPGGQLRLLRQRVEPVGVDPGDQRPGRHPPQRLPRPAAAAGDVVAVHRLGEDDVAARVEAPHQLVGVVVEVGLHLVAAGPPRVLAVLRAAAETGLQLRLAAVGDVGEPPGGAQPGVRALP